LPGLGKIARRTYFGRQFQRATPNHGNVVQIQAGLTRARAR